MLHGNSRQPGVRKRGRTGASAGEELADLLSDPHCRYLLDHLRETDSPVPVSTATRYVVGRITDTSPEDVSENVRRRVETWFHHGLLPLLDDHGVVEFDPEDGTVSLAGESAPRKRPTPTEG